jgi:hypothetical protein
VLVGRGSRTTNKLTHGYRRFLYPGVQRQGAAEPLGLRVNGDLVHQGFPARRTSGLNHSPASEYDQRREHSEAVQEPRPTATDY